MGIRGGAEYLASLPDGQHNAGTLATNKGRLVSSYDPSELVRLARRLAGIEEGSPTILGL
ncbi:MAG TPA: hypothetical protein VMW62_04260 [Chloroflexota bacterium]|nr:hypothetical protein [Chloroflexota bacterium]